jgi:hypothetical protein
LSFGLAFAGAIMLATLSFSFTAAANDSTVLSAPQKDQVSTVLEHDAQLMSDEQLTELLADEPPDVSAEILRINDDVRPLALQIGLLVPVLAALVGFVQATRMTREPDPTPSEAAEGLLIG